MDSLRLGMLAVIAPDPESARLARLHNERLEAEARQHLVLSWIAEKKLLHRDIAAAIGVHPSTVTAVLRGRAHLPKAWLKPLAALLGVTRVQLSQAWRPWLRKRRPFAILSRKEENARKLITELLAERRIRQRDLAKAIGVRQSDISNAVQGRRRIPERWYAAVANFFGIPADCFEVHPLEETPEQSPVKRRRVRRKPLPYPTFVDDRVRQIREAMSRQRIRQEHLAKALGLSQSTISYMLNGRFRIRPTWYPTIAALLSISLDAT
jgi:transcriptional regulator with XRE-family HTH domain